MSDTKKKALQNVAKKLESAPGKVGNAAKKQPAPADNGEPPWLPDALGELNRIQGTHAQKKQDTIIELVRARLEGRSMEDVWKMPHTCSRTTYWKQGGWKEDPIFISVLENVSQIARDWKNTRGLRAVHSAAEALRLYAPLAVRKVFETMQNEADPRVALSAANSILNRAGIDTAQKMDHAVAGRDGGPLRTLSAHVSGNIEDLSEAELDALIQNLQVAVVGGSGSESGEDVAFGEGPVFDGDDGSLELDDPLSP